LKRKQTNLPSREDIKNLADKLLEELRANYKTNRKSSPIIERLKVVAALKLWENRGFRDVRFEVPLPFGGRTVFVKVLAREGERLVGVECLSGLDWGWLRGRVALLHGCLPVDSYLIIIFPSAVDEQASRAAYLADEVWVTDKDNSRVANMMFISVCHNRE
jgi:hypothetical protein